MAICPHDLRQNKGLWGVVVVVFNLLRHLTLGHVQVAVADPLHMEPVTITPISTALKLELQHVDGALQVASPRYVCVLVIAHGIVQAHIE